MPRPHSYTWAMTDVSKKTPGLLLVISGPSGTGKTTIVNALGKRLDGVFSVSVTTRPPSVGEVDGREYRFLSRAEFSGMVTRGVFLEHARVFGDHYYGTPQEPVLRHLAHGRLVILNIDVQGAVKVKQAMPDALMIFILPPSEQELLRRLRDRGREDEADIQRRFTEATGEIQRATDSGVYDARIVNEDLQQAINEAYRLVQERWERAGGGASGGGGGRGVAGP